MSVNVTIERAFGMEAKRFIEESEDKPYRAVRCTVLTDSIQTRALYDGVQDNHAMVKVVSRRCSGSKREE
jgi:hypothetical protein